MSPFGEYGSWVGLTLNVLVLCVCFYLGAFPVGEANMDSQKRAYEFFLEMISLVIAIFLYLVYKLVYRTRVVKLSEMDLHTGRQETIPEEVLEQERAEQRAQPLWKKVLSFLY